MANDEAARYAVDQVIPLTEDRQNLNSEYIKKHLDLALRIFTKANSVSISKQIDDHYTNS